MLLLEGDKFSIPQFLKTKLEKEARKQIPYASAVGCPIYAQVCIRPDITYVVSVFRRFQSKFKDGPLKNC